MSAHLDQIKPTLERFAAAWQTNDGAALGGYFTDTGTLVNPFGQRADGRAAVAAMYSEYFKGLLGGTSTKFNLASASVRAVENDYAFVDTQQTIHAPDGSIVLDVHLVALMRRQADGWRFVDARPYSYATVPG